MGPHRCSSMSSPWHCVSMRFACGSLAGPDLPAEAPGGEADRTQLTGVDGSLGHLHRLRIAMVEVEPEPEVALGRLGDERIRLRKVEHERLLHQQRHARADDGQRRLVVGLVGQAHRHQVGLLSLQQRGQIRVASDPELGRAGIDLGLAPPQDPGQLRVRPGVIDPGVMVAPPLTRTDDGDLQLAIGGPHAPSSVAVTFGTVAGTRRERVASWQ